ALGVKIVPSGIVRSATYLELLVQGGGCVGGGGDVGWAGTVGVSGTSVAAESGASGVAVEICAGVAIATTVGTEADPSWTWTIIPASEVAPWLLRARTVRVCSPGAVGFQDWITENWAWPWATGLGSSRTFSPSASSATLMMPAGSVETD